MTDFQSGRTSGVFAAGSSVDDLLEVYEAETVKLEAMKSAFMMATKALEEYKAEIDRDVSAAKIPLKDAEYGRLYVGKCADVMRKLYLDAETQRLQSTGAATAMRQAVARIKELHDSETKKLKSHEEWERGDKDLRERPVGADPVVAPAKSTSRKRNKDI